MEHLLPGIVLSMREWLEAWLILILIVQYLGKTNHHNLKKNIIYGVIASIVCSLVVAYLLQTLSHVKNIGPLRESVMSLIAVWLIVSFIVWMIRHSYHIKSHIQEQISINMTPIGIFLVSFVMIVREGLEIAVFSFAGKYSIWSIMIGLCIASLIALAIYYSLLHINLKKLLHITLIYLIIQAWYLCGYSIHEWLAVLQEASYVSDTWWMKLFDVSHGIWNHKEWIIGLPLNIVFWRYSKPEVIQFVWQYILTIMLLWYWYRKSRNQIVSNH